MIAINSILLKQHVCLPIILTDLWKTDIKVIPGTLVRRLKIDMRLKKNELILPSASLLKRVIRICNSGSTADESAQTCPKIVCVCVWL